MSMDSMQKERLSMATKNETKAPVSKITEPLYTVEEFAKAPQTLGVNTPDLIRAAFKTAGKTEATVSEANAILKKFKSKEVK